MVKFGVLPILVLPFLVGCLSVSHNVSMRDGLITQRTCVNGDCHTLLGKGTISYNSAEGLVKIKCEGENAIVYNPDELSGYDCTSGNVLQR